MRSTFKRGPGDEALTLAEAPVQAQSGCPFTEVLPPNIAWLCWETVLARSLFRHREARLRSFARGNYLAFGPRLNK